MELNTEIVSTPEVTGITPAVPVSENPTVETPDAQQTQGEIPAIPTDETDGADKAPKGVQKRIDELTRLRRDAERDRDYWREMAMKQADRGGAQKVDRPGTSQDQMPAAVAVQPTAKRPAEAEFESYDAYLEALADWKAEVKLAEFRQSEINRTEEGRRKAEAEAKERTMAQKWDQYQGKARVLAEKATDFFDLTQDPTLPISPAMAEAIVDSDHGPYVMYWLAKNRGEAARIKDLPPLSAAREIGRIEHRLISQSTPSPKTTTAPDPINPIGGNNPPSTFDPEKSSFKEYEEWRNKQAFGK